MGAFIGEFIFELVKLIILVAVALIAIFCGKKLRDRKTAKIASGTESKNYKETLEE